MSIITRREESVGYVEIDFPPVNAIGLSVRRGLLEAVHWAESERLARVIVSGTVFLPLAQTLVSSTVPRPSRTCPTS